MRRVADPEEVKGFCSKCGQRNAPPRQRYCKDCRNAYMRERRRCGKEGIGPGESRRNKSRRLARAAKQMGFLVEMPCEGCGSPEVEMHHEDYEKPLDIRWLRPTCHYLAHNSA